MGLSNASGFFAVTGVVRSLSLQKTGYVLRTANVPEGLAVDLGSLNLQRTITLAVGSRVSSQISSADVPYDLFYMWDLGFFCSPCKWIDLKPAHQDLAIQLRWSGDVPLTLWAEDSHSYDPMIVVSAKPGDSALTALIPAAFDVVLIGIRSETFTQQLSHSPCRSSSPQPRNN